MLLGLGLRLLLAAAAVTAVAAIVVYVTGSITRAKLREKLRDNNMKDAIITAIDRCDNVVKLKDLTSDKELEVHGDDVDYDVVKGNKIYV